MDVEARNAGFLPRETFEVIEEALAQDVLTNEVKKLEIVLPVKLAGDRREDVALLVPLNERLAVGISCREAFEPVQDPVVAFACNVLLDLTPVVARVIREEVDEVPHVDRTRCPQGGAVEIFIEVFESLRRDQRPHFFPVLLSKASCFRLEFLVIPKDQSPSG